MRPEPPGEGITADLKALAANLRAQAAPDSSIVLDSTVFPSSQLDLIRSAFDLPAGANLKIAGVTPADILDPGPDGVLDITVGTAGLLNQSCVGIDLSFTEESGMLQVVIVATMGGPWRFGASFSDLDRFPFQNLTTSDARFAYTTVKRPAYPWPGEKAFTIDLEPGLNFLSQVTFGNFAAITNLLGIGTQTWKLYGPFAPAAGQFLPAGTLLAPLGARTFSVGVGPNALCLSNPAVAVQIGLADENDPVQSVDLLVQADFQETLKVSVGIPMAGNILEVSTTPLPHHASINSLIEALPGGAGFLSYIPAELSSAFTNVGLDNFSMVVDPTPKVTYLGLSISTLQPWPVIPGVLVLDTMALRIETVDPTGNAWTRVFITAEAEFLPKIFPNKFVFSVGLEKQSAWEVGTVSGAYFGAVGLGDMVAGLLSSQDSVPAALRAISFSNFGVNATRSAPGGPFTYNVSGSVEVAFPLLDQQLTAYLTVAATKVPDSYTILLTGGLAIGDQAFSLELDLATKGSRLTAQWKDTGTPLGFGEIASAFGWDSMPPMPENLDLGLTSAKFVYDFTEGTLAFSALSTHGEMVFVSFLGGPHSAQPASRFYVFSLDLEIGVSFADLPAVGPNIPPALNVAIDALQVVLASHDLNRHDLQQVTDLLVVLGDEPLMATVINTGVTFAGDLTVGTEKVSLVLPVSRNDQGGPRLPAIDPLHVLAPEARPGSASATTPAPVQAHAAAPAPAYSGLTKWFEVSKSLGPVSLQRIGVQYTDSTLFFLFDVSLVFSTLSLACQGLGVGSPLTNFTPKFHLDGMAITFSDGPVAISGGLFAQHVSVQGQDVLDYNGEALIKAETWSIATLGSWATFNGLPSLFVFAMLDDPLGGPPFFFVTGISAGFGYNRSLVLPAQNEVQNFPLVAGLTDPSKIGGDNAGPAEAMNALGKWVNVTPGAYWLAAGVQFTSFELIKSNALVVVEFGLHFDIAILGLSRIKLPQTGSVTYAYVELGLKVIVDPGAGLFAATALISPNSYVIDPACHLTGGFAFFIWYGDNKHAGDFVLTIGGYHPLFDKPDWYPDEPRLGFSWQVSDQVSMQGDAYFALTPSCCMGGGELDIQFHSGDLAAWLTVHADFLIQWKPFYFVVSAGVSIGVSYRLKLLFVTTTIKVELGADLALWGPPTGGNVDIHLWIVSFSVSFGPDFGTGNDYLPWKEFRTLLPQDSKRAPVAGRIPAAMFAAPVPADPPSFPHGNVCKITVNRGLMPQQDPAGRWLVRSDEFQFTVETAFPLTELDLVGPTATTALLPPTLDPVDPNAPRCARADGYYIGVRPMGISCTDSVLSLTVRDVTQAPGLILDLDGAWTFQVTTRAVPEAMWGQPIPKGATPTASANALPGRLVGLSLVSPRIITPTGPDAIPVANLSYDTINQDHDAYLPFPQPPENTAPAASTTSIRTIASTIADAAGPDSPVATRAAIFAALNELGFTGSANGDMSALAACIDLNYPSAPMLGSPMVAPPGSTSELTSST